jgi:hypothetical protein
VQSFTLICISRVGDGLCASKTSQNMATIERAAPTLVRYQNQPRLVRATLVRSPAPLNRPEILTTKTEG